MTPLDFARLCQESYEGGAQFVDVDDLRFGVIDRGESIAVVFRGSANLHNWLLDVEAFPCVTEGGHLAHHGFVSAVEKLRDVVAAKLPQDGRPVIYTGHSLGGAIAAIFAQETGSQAVTFGCPRVWWFKDEPPVINHVRVICDDDPVPLVPRFSFQHDKTEAILLLTDHDRDLINPQDHCIGNYVERLQKGEA